MKITTAFCWRYFYYQKHKEVIAYMDDFLILLQAKLDEAKSKGNVNTNIKELQNQLDKLKVQVELDPKAAQKLADDIGKLVNQKIVISNIGIDAKSGIKAGQEYGKQISQGISQGISTTSKSTDKILRDFSELYDAKRQFVGGHDLISKDDIVDAEKLYDTVRKTFSEFGQVTVSKGSLNNGSLESMRVKIEQVNGEMKITRDFMLYFNEAKNGFKLVDDDTIHTTEKMIQHLNEEKNIINATNEEANAIKEKLAEQEKYYKNIKNEVNNLYSLKTKLLSADELQTAELEKQIKQTKERISYNNRQIDKKDLRDNSLDRQINDLEVVKQKQLALSESRTLDTLNAKAQAEAQKQVNNALKEQRAIQSKVDNGDYDKRFEVLKASYQRLGLTSDEIRTKTNEVSIALDKLKEKNLDTLVQDEKDFANALKRSQNEASILRTDLENIYNPKKQTKLANDIQDWLSKNSRASKEAKESLNAYYRELNGGRVSVDRLNYIEQELKNVDSLQRKLGKLGKNLKDQFAEASKSFTQWLSVSSGIMALVYQLQKIPKEVIAVNSAMVELRKVSDASALDIAKYFDEAAKSAKELGSSVSDVISATADFSRLGYSLPDSAELARVATLYKNVGDGIDISEASSSIVSTMKAFKIEAEDAISIVDKFNQVGNDFAISSGEIGDALKRSASSLAVAGNTISESIGLITAGNTVVQDADTVGTALKTLSLRITSTSAELEELGEDTEFACETLSDYRDLVIGLTHNKVDIIGTDGDYKSTYQMLKEISEVWADMNSMEQSSLMKALFGARQANIGASILENFDVAEAAMKTAEEAAGSALREQEAYEKGVQYSLDRLEASFQTFANHILDSDFLKGIINFGNGVINVIDTVTSKLGSLGTIGFGTGIFGIFKNVDYLKTPVCPLYI